MPILCYGSQSPISNRVHALTSFVLPVHSLGVSYASERGQSPKLNFPLTSDPSAEIPIVSTQHPIWADVNCVISLTHRTVLQKERCPPFQTPPEGGGVPDLCHRLVKILHHYCWIILGSIFQHSIKYSGNSCCYCHY